MKPTQPAPRGAGRSEARASLACEDRRLVGCARASVTVAEVGERRRGPEKRDSPSATGHVDGDQASRAFARKLRGSKASDASIAVAKPRSWNRLEPGARKGVAGQRSSLDGRHLGSLRCPSRSRERAEGGLGGPLEDSCTRERRGPREGGDRGVRGSVRTHRGGKTTPTTVRTRGDRAAHRSELLCRAAGTLSGCADAKASDAAENVRGTGTDTKK